MKKQITEIEREIIEKSNRTLSTTITTSSSPAVSAASLTSQSNYKSVINVPLTTLSNQHSSSVNAEKQNVDPRTADIDLESLDPLGKCKF